VATGLMIRETQPEYAQALSVSSPTKTDKGGAASKNNRTPSP